MRYLRIAIYCLAVFILIILLSVIPVSAEPPLIAAEAAVAIATDSADIIVSQNPHQKLPMASTTKIMTALIAIEHCKDPDEIITVPREACDIEGSSIYLFEGEETTVRTLLYGLLLNSGNDAAVALAVHTAGSIDAFADLMNERAAMLGAVNTHFTNPHGLHDDAHYTTAYDLALIARAAMLNPLFAAIAAEKSIRFGMPDGTPYRYFSNHNKLLKLYPYATGVKTGYTKISGRCLVGAAEKDGISVITVTLKASDDYNDHIRMFEYAFSVCKKVPIDEAPLIGISVVGGTQDSVPVIADDVGDTVVSSDDTVIRRVLNIPRFLYAPVHANDVIGTADYYCGDVLIRSVSVRAMTNVPYFHTPSHWEKFCNLIKGVFD